MKVFAIASVLLVVSCAWAAPSAQDNRVDSDQSSTLARAARYLGSCLESDDMTTCFAVKGITALNRAARSNNIELMNGVAFKRDPASPVQRSGKALSEHDIYAQLPETAEDRNGRLVDMAMQTAAEFFGSHNLEVKVPAEATQEVARAIDEGRGKMKKLMGPIALAIGAKLFALLPILIGGLALLTFKAVIVAKIALLVALFVGGSRFFGGIGNKFGGGGSSGIGGYSSNTGYTSGATNGWSSGASSAYPYARSMNGDGDDEAQAQQLAYAGQVGAQ